jgi:hypothetical protein
MTFVCSRFGDCEDAYFVADFLSTDMDLRMMKLPPPPPPPPPPPLLISCHGYPSGFVFIILNQNVVPKQNRKHLSKMGWKVE